MTGFLYQACSRCEVASAEPVCFECGEPYDIAHRKDIYLSPTEPGTHRNTLAALKRQAMHMGAGVLD